MRFISRYLKQILTGIFAVVVAMLMLTHPAPHSRILNIQDYLITVAGIISAFVIAYLSSKIFNLRSERTNRQVEIDNLSNKLTNFRRLLFYVMRSSNFWIHYDDITQFKKQYPGLNYARLHNQTDNSDKLSTQFWLEEKHISHSTIDLYTAMEALYGDPNFTDGLPWATDKAIRFNYTVDELYNYYSPSNMIWYLLEGRFEKHGKGQFHDSNISPLFADDVTETLVRIDTKYKGKDFHREILAEIGAEFHELYLTQLIELTQYNTGVPKSLQATFNSLFVIMMSGVLLPIIIQSLDIPNSLDTILTLLCVWVTSLALVLFLWDFYSFLRQDIHTVNNET